LKIYAPFQAQVIASDTGVAGGNCIASDKLSEGWASGISSLWPFGLRKKIWVVYLYSLSICRGGSMVGMG